MSTDHIQKCIELIESTLDIVPDRKIAKFQLSCFNQELNRREHSCPECHGEGCTACGNKGYVDPDEPTLEDR